MKSNNDVKNRQDVAVDKLYRSVRGVIEQARGFVSIAANTAMVRQNWEIGRLIVEDEQGGKRKAAYGKAQIDGLAARLTLEFGDGFTATNLRYMRQFYLAFPICHTLCDELSWSHYRILMRVSDPRAREWYMNECVACGWGTRELDRQVSTQAYARLLSAANSDRRRSRVEVPNTPPRSIRNPWFRLTSSRTP